MTNESNDRDDLDRTRDRFDGSRRIFMKTVGTAVGAAGLGSTAAAAASDGRDSNDQFTVDGHRIYDPDGDRFVGIGANLDGVRSAWGSYTPDEKYVEAVVDHWDLNIVRAAHHYEFRDEVASGGWPVLDGGFSWEELVDAYTEHDVVVMPEVHCFTGGLFNDGIEGDLDYGLEDLKDFWRDMAQRFGDNPYVWFNIMNEPGEGDSADYYDEWVEWHNECIDVIRDEGADNVIVATGMYWGQDAGAAWGDRTRVEEDESAILSRGREILEHDPASNVVFDFHAYDQWTASDEMETMLENFIEDAYAQGLSLFVGEWGAPEDPWSQHMKDGAPHVLPTILPYNVGSTMWHGEPGDGFKPTHDGGLTTIDDTEDPSNLTWWQGEPLWNATRQGVGKITVNVKSSINPGRPGTIPVTVSGSDDINPVDDLDIATVRFGAPSDVETGNGASPETYSRQGSSSAGTLNIRFSSEEAGFTDEDDRAVLVGETSEGSIVTGYTGINNVKSE